MEICLSVDSNPSHLAVLLSISLSYNKQVAGTVEGMIKAAAYKWIMISNGFTDLMIQ